MAADYAVLITTPSGSHMLDAVDNFQVTGQNEMTSHPMVTGDVVGDHIIVQPCQITFNGTISLNASSPVKSLSSIQKTFEDLKDNGTLCTVAKVKTANNEFRFLKRNNMVLTGIVWTEHINSVDFNFTFNQALLDNVAVTQVAAGKFLPDIVEPRTLTFQGTLISTEELYNEIIKALIDSGIVDEQFLEQAITSGMWILGGAALSALSIIGLGAAGIGIAAGSAIAGTAAVAAVSSMIPVAGWVVAAGIGVAVAAWGIANLITEAIEAGNLKFKAFKTDFEDYEEERAENERFASMMDQIYTQVSVVNDWFRCYGFDSDDPQECMLNIGGTYHVFTLTRNNVASSWSCAITTFDGGGEKEVCSKKISFAKEYGGLGAGDAFCKIKTSSGSEDTTYYVYFVGNGKLTESFMLVASIEPSKFTESLIDVIESAIYVDSDDA